MKKSRRSYPSDLSNAEWKILEPLIPACKPGGRPRSVDMREVLNSIFYILRGGSSWRMMPNDLVKWGTAYDYFRTWSRDGTWERMNDVLRRRVRVASGREEEPSAVCIDSQSSKTTSKGGFAGMMEIRKSTEGSVTS